jgi:hypothetical protein
LSKRRRKYEGELDEDGEDFLTIMGGPLPTKTKATSSGPLEPQPQITSFSYELFGVAIRESRLAPAAVSKEAPLQSSSNHVQTAPHNNDASAKCKYCHLHVILPYSYSVSSQLAF